MDWKFKRSAFRRPAAQLEHVDVTIRFFEDRVEAEGTLHLRARAAMREIALDLEGRKVVYPLDRDYATGEAFSVAVAHVSHPDDARLEGIYRDATPPGAPQQYMSQCQQFGFQRILPIIDDCTAKSTFRTTLEGDARYTHLISNGDLVADEPIAGGRRRCVYEMRRPMAPYLFLACAGTWEVLTDAVTYPDTGRTVRLEYLVPPGRRAGARIPMEILKRSVLFQHARTGFEYPFKTYRTICMEKSLYGGMENT
ncbi:MAG: M1 family metallopeptidase, partial [Kiritimatiellia bacterium]